MDKPLTHEQLVAVLDQWVGSLVTIRVVSESADLLAVFRGALDGRTDEKQPALFWPLRTPGQSHHFERPGIYLHPERFEEAVAHEGEFVLELRQAAVTLNIRRLSFDR
jgi:hypothetical protein